MSVNQGGVWATAMINHIEIIVSLLPQIGRVFMYSQTAPARNKGVAARLITVLKVSLIIVNSSSNYVYANIPATIFGCVQFFGIY